jgi:hypothetical protein
MSIQAVAWALGQKIPGTNKLVLIALANYADEETGHCWPSVEKIAHQASCSPRSVHSYIGALRRNGFLDVRSGRSKAGRVRTNDYWLLMDRPRVPWDATKGIKSDDQDLDEEETPQVEETSEDISANLADFADGISANTLPTNHHYSNHQESFPVEGRNEPSPEARSEPRSVAVVSPPQVLAPPGFDPKARQAALERHQAAEKARSKNRRVPVIEGTKAWEAHVRAGHPRTLVGIILVDGKPRRGWEFRTLFPPKSTGPPPNPLMTEADEAELARGI